MDRLPVFLLSAALAASFASAQTATMTGATGADMSLPATWSNAIGITATEAEGWDYEVAGKDLQTPNNVNVAAKAQSLSVTGGSLSLVRNHASGYETRTYSFPGLALADSNLRLLGTTGGSYYDISTPLSFSGNSAITRVSGGYSQKLTFTSASGISGSGVLTVQNSTGNPLVVVNNAPGSYTGQIKLANAGNNDSAFELNQPVGAADLTVGGTNGRWALKAGAGALTALRSFTVERANTTIELTGANTLTDFTLAGATFKGSGALTLDLDEDCVLSAAVAITEAVSLVKNGAGALTLSGTGNTFSGGLILNAGAVSVTAFNGLGIGPLTLNAGEIALGQARPSVVTVNGESSLSLTLTAQDFSSPDSVILPNVTEASPGLLTVAASDSEGNVYPTQLVNNQLLLIKDTADLVWTGSENTQWGGAFLNWLAAGETPRAFSPGDGAFFPASAANAVEVGDSVIASGLHVEGEGYSFTGAGGIQSPWALFTQSASLAVPLQTWRMTVEAGMAVTASSLIALPGGKYDARFIKLLFTGNNGAADGVAVAELMLFADSRRVAWPGGSTVALSPGSTSASNANELPRSLIDGYYGNGTGNTGWGYAYKNNKLWINNATTDRMSGDLVYAVIELPQTVSFNAYRICSTDHGPRNPTGWKLFTSMDGENWRSIDSKGSLGAEAGRANTWYGDTTASTITYVPAGPPALQAPAALSGNGDITAGTLAGSFSKAGTGLLTLSGDNSTATAWLGVTEGSARLGTTATAPKKIDVASGATAEVDFRGNPSLAQLDGSGLLNLILNAEAGFSASGNFSGVIRLHPGSVGATAKLRFDQSAISLSSSCWFEVMPGAQLWANQANAVSRNIRIAGEGGGANVEQFGGALRMQNGAALNGKIEVMADASITGNGRTCGSTVTVAQSAESAPTLSLGVAAVAYGTAVEGNLTFTGAFSGREDLPLNLAVNAYTTRLQGGAGNNMGSLAVRHRGVGSDPFAAAVLEGGKSYAFASVSVGGNASKTESLTVTNATLTVSGALTVSESSSTLSLLSGGRLAYSSGAIEGTLALGGGSALQPLSFADPLTVATVVPPAAGTVALVIDESLAPVQPWARAYILRTPTRLPVTAFTGVPEKWRLVSDATGLYLTRDVGTVIMLF